MTLEASLPPITLSGGKASVRQRIHAQLRAHGYRAVDDAREGQAGALINVICPTASDADSMETLTRTLVGMLAHDTPPESVARLIVLPRPGEQMRAALAAARGCGYVAIVQDSSSGDALARQIGLAARWLGVRPPLMYMPASDAPCALTTA